MRSKVRLTPSELLLTGCQLIDGVSDDPFRNQFVEIRDGKVVTEGLQKVREGAPVQPMTAQETAKAAEGAGQAEAARPAEGTKPAKE